MRDGGSARIYSDTSGFTLRDGRSAELVVTGENAGDWEFVAAAPSDAIDAWVSDRERIWRSDSSTTSSTSTNLFGAPKSLKPTAIGITRTSTAGSGGRTHQSLAATLIGRHIATVAGRGVRLMAGRGLDTSPGDGRLITTAVGSITITTGPGRRAANTFASAVGGGPRSWRSTSRSATTSAGIRCRTIKGIRIRVTIVVTIVIVIGIEIGDRRDGRRDGRHSLWRSSWRDASAAAGFW